MQNSGTEGTVREFRSEYYARPLTGKLIGSRLISAVGIFAATFGISAVLHRPYDPEQRVAPGHIQRIVEGLASMTPHDYRVTFLIAVPLVLLTLLLMNRYNDVKIIVGFSFRVAERKLKIRVRTPSGVGFSETMMAYSDIRLSFPVVGDGMTGGSYETITFLREGTVIGHYFKGQPIWKDVDTSELEKEIEGTWRKA
jgi:hypothetical protein